MFKPVPFSSIGMSEARAYDGFSDFSQTPNTQLNFLSIYLDYFSRKFFDTLFYSLCVNLKYNGGPPIIISFCLRAPSILTPKNGTVVYNTWILCEMRKKKKTTKMPQKTNGNMTIVEKLLLWTKKKSFGQRIYRSNLLGLKV